MLQEAMVAGECYLGSSIKESAMHVYKELILFSTAPQFYSLIAL